MERNGTTTFQADSPLTFGFFSGLTNYHYLGFANCPLLGGPPFWKLVRSKDEMDTIRDFFSHMYDPKNPS